MKTQKISVSIIVIIIGILIIGGGIYIYSIGGVENTDTDSSPERFVYFISNLDKADLVTNQPVNISGEEKWIQLSNYWDYYYSPLESVDGEDIGITYYGYPDGVKSIYYVFRINNEAEIVLYKDYISQEYLKTPSNFEKYTKSSGVTFEEMKDRSLSRLKFYEVGGYLISTISGQEPVLSPESLFIIE
jgi:hypothetical protein